MTAEVGQRVRYTGTTPWGAASHGTPPTVESLMAALADSSPVRALPLDMPSGTEGEVVAVSPPGEQGGGDMTVETVLVQWPQGDGIRVTSFSADEFAANFEVVA